MPTHAVSPPDLVLGCHLSIAGGFPRAVDEAERVGANALQIFSHSPSVWRASPITPEAADAFRGRVADSPLRFVIVHAIYLLNLASPVEVLYERSIAGLGEELARADALGVRRVVTHLGAHRGAGADVGVRRAARAIRRALDEGGDGARLLIENAAGSGTTLGGRFSELAAVLDLVDDPRLGVCLDTCHAFAAGYDLRSARAIDRTLRAFDREIGLARLWLVHLNDSRYALGARRDRHEHLGRGAIGDGLAAFVGHPAVRGAPLVLETPKTLDGRSGADEVNLAWVRKARGIEEVP